MLNRVFTKEREINNTQIRGPICHYDSRFSQGGSNQFQLTLNKLYCLEGLNLQKKNSVHDVTATLLHHMKHQDAINVTK